MNMTVKKGERVTIKVVASKAAYLVAFSDNDCGPWEKPDDFSGVRTFVAPTTAGHCDGFDVLFTFTRDDTGRPLTLFRCRFRSSICWILSQCSKGTGRLISLHKEVANTCLCNTERKWSRSPRAKALILHKGWALFRPCRTEVSRTLWELPRYLDLSRVAMPRLDIALQDIHLKVH